MQVGIVLKMLYSELIKLPLRLGCNSEIESVEIGGQVVDDGFYIEQPVN